MGEARKAPARRRIEATIVALLGERAPGKTICPSEVARALGGEEGMQALMEPVREAARAMVARGKLEVTQRGKVVDPEAARGPIRLRLPGAARSSEEGA